LSPPIRRLLAAIIPDSALKSLEMPGAGQATGQPLPRAPAPIRVVAHKLHRDGLAVVPTAEWFVLRSGHFSKSVPP
jgi:hypothetical protein